MNNPGIFLIQPNGELVEMNEQAYDSETVLQKLLAEYPSLLAGHQIDPDEPRRWLLIKRECGVPSEEGGSSRWSTDHLFLDQDAVPTIVETKIRDNTDLRRKIVGQMLDYAANAVVHWPVSYIRERFAVTCEERRLDPEERLSEFLGVDSDAEEFWANADRNLRDGNIRLLFVADEIPTELQRIVEFLNEQMHRTEVLAVEIKQYVDDRTKQRGLVPRVIGRTAEAITTKGPKRPPSTVEEIIDAIRAKSAEGAMVAQRIHSWSDEHFTKISYTTDSFVPEFEYDLEKFRPIAIKKGGKLWIKFGEMKQKPFDDPEKRLELLRRLNEAGANLSEDKLDRFPTLDLSLLVNNDAFEKFKDAIAWAIGEVKKAGQGGTTNLLSKSKQS